MAKNFWFVVDRVIKESDIIIEVIDARFIEETRNKELERKVKRANKRLIHAINKSDLIKDFVDDIALPFKNFVFISAKENLGTSRLRSMIKDLCKKRPLNVGVVGYPNTGKSSLINTLKQKRAAGTSSTPGFTKGMQKIKVSEGIYLIDTPGVIHYRLEDEAHQAIINTKDVNKIKDPEAVALRIIDKIVAEDQKILEDFYNIKCKSLHEDTLREIALRFNWLLKGGEPNIDMTARRIINDWQRGKLIIKS
ncbi:50S ribosome-binding GTPase [Candidatus Woesearchaeota archaeon]|nr:MAG: hypothetical protein QT09_C0006G0087 [archaeon GW2011_AR18]MBS3161741.1 50S ribosome-binding GTPase [Candidatus Woesearchaeota archaeon]HIH26303.1 GTPase [Nanoarchaeota archaeon]